MTRTTPLPQPPAILDAPSEALRTFYRVTKLADEVAAECARMAPDAARKADLLPLPT